MKLEEMETIHDLQAESPYDSIEAMTTVVASDTQVTHMYESHHEELSLFDENFPYEEEIQELLNNEELQDDTCEFSPFHILMPPPVINDHIYDDYMWLNPPPPFLAQLIHAYQVLESELSQVKHTSLTFPHIAKLEGVQNQETHLTYFTTHIVTFPSLTILSYTTKL
ncbi:hypothetical protein TorRG33x02_356450 [Trema orientale]|uniref:Uncharacterized protein n=1 Tax=Trema orientale TaxID=63057 RepID=A0A2P5A775_TREOI|nr:hypothetical protein TorRG33x02_356450 [Trema orientale]